MDINKCKNDYKIIYFKLAKCKTYILRNINQYYGRTKNPSTIVILKMSGRNLISKYI